MDRTFKDLRASSGEHNAFELAWRERFDDDGVSWEELLKSQRILIVSEAGSGKTYECDSKARKLFARGEPAFFVSLESVASAGVLATLFGDDLRRFTPPVPTRIVWVADAMRDMRISGELLAVAGIPWCSDTQNRVNPVLRVHRDALSL